MMAGAHPAQLGVCFVQAGLAVAPTGLPHVVDDFVGPRDIRPRRTADRHVLELHEQENEFAGELFAPSVHRFVERRPFLKPWKSPQPPSWHP